MPTRHYKCQWCNHEFDQAVVKSQGEPDISKGYPQPSKKQTLSDQVKCRCGNFLKTWG